MYTVLTSALLLKDKLNQVNKFYISALVLVMVCTNYSVKTVLTALQLTLLSEK